MAYKVHAFTPAIQPMMRRNALSLLHTADASHAHHLSSASTRGPQRTRMRMQMIPLMPLGLVGSGVGDGGASVLVGQAVTAVGAGASSTVLAHNRDTHALCVLYKCFIERHSPHSLQVGASPWAADVMGLLQSLLPSPLAQDVVCTLVCAIAATLWLKIWTSSAKKGLIEPNLSRKIVHAGSGPLFLLVRANVDSVFALLH